MVVKRIPHFDWLINTESITDSQTPIYAQIMQLDTNQINLTNDSFHLPKKTLNIHTLASKNVTTPFSCWQTNSRRRASFVVSRIAGERTCFICCVSWALHPAIYRGRNFFFARESWDVKGKEVKLSQTRMVVDKRINLLNCNTRCSRLQWGLSLVSNEPLSVQSWYILHASMPYSCPSYSLLNK